MLLHHVNFDQRYFLEDIHNSTYVHPRGDNACYICAGSCHKWLFSPRGLAIQWVSPQHHGLIHPARSGMHWDQPHPDNLMNQGCRDDTPYCVAPDTVDFYNWIGGKVAMFALVIVNHCLLIYDGNELNISHIKS